MKQKTHTIIVVAILVLLLLLVFQNLRTVIVSFLFWDRPIPLAVFAIIIFLLGFATGNFMIIRKKR